LIARAGDTIHIEDQTACTRASIGCTQRSCSSGKVLQNVAAVSGVAIFNVTMT
jgi:hypothetical protein